MSSLFSSLYSGQYYEDPLFPYAHIPYVEEYLVPLFPSALEKVAYHIHEIIIIIGFYHFIFVLSSLVSPLLVDFSKVPRKTQIDFHVHVVSFVQSVIIVILALPLNFDQTLYQDRVFATTPYSSLVTTAAFAYFVWDSIISTVYISLFGVQFLVHGIISSIVFFIGMTPFIQYYAGVFILFELSTPFLNLRWFGIKFPHWFNGTFNLINNIVLILIFFFVRICFGWYQAITLFTDFSNSVQDPRFNTVYALIIFFGYNILGVLNFYWFYRMAKVAVAIISDMVSGKDDNDAAKKDI
ncbi:hypothetical protein WICPIJ_001614 [Wickerhamomyces pijperi]|uniref:TLC domain-containing protein n=1 Tax=Wickerhamomyces pijperi TaxID=599730 RepID=A0A9P8QBD1_WICPI|nr:hypothetical protein WICPIJ_001614 [Wickerhamomyces pijperi]